MSKLFLQAFPAGVVCRVACDGRYFAVDPSYADRLWDYSRSVREWGARQTKRRRLNMTIPTYRIHVAVSFSCECGRALACSNVPAVKLCRCGRQYTIRGQAQISIADEIIDLTPFDVTITDGPAQFIGQHAIYDPHSKCIQPDSIKPNHWYDATGIQWQRI